MVHRDVKEVRKFMIEHSKVTLVLKGLTLGTLLVVQWLRLCTPNVGGPGSIPHQGTGSHMLQLRVRMLQPRPSTARYIHIFTKGITSCQLQRWKMHPFLAVCS